MAQYSNVEKENKKRWDILNAPYIPFLGIGSPIERFPLQYSDSGDGVIINLPKTMEDNQLVETIIEFGSIEKASKAIGYDIDYFTNMFDAVRCMFDFEYWASLCVKIQTKEKGILPFVLNFPQRILLAELERQRLAGVPIRIILLKHRQWGGSTLVQLYMAWIQIFHKTDWHSAIVADVQQQSLHVRAMYERMAQYHPANIILPVTGISKIELSSYQGTKNIKKINGRNCIIGVGSVQEPEALRSFTFQMLHMSEIGLWQSTEKINAESLAQTLAAALVDAPYTLCVKESTAKGVGTYFHGEWLRAKNKESNDVPVFIEWFRDTQYVLPLTVTPDEFVALWDDYEKMLWSLGATLEHINWRRKKKRDYKEAWRFVSEYPSTDVEAFGNTDNRVFALPYVVNMRNYCKEPIAIGDIVSDSLKGKESLKNIQFINNEKGFVKIWTFPNTLGIEKSGKMYTNRYCAFGDVGGRTKGADYSVITILDRIMTLYGGVPFVAAEFHGHLDQDLFAWYGARLCQWYEKALYAIEINSLDTEKESESDSSFTVLNEIKDFYDNLFYRVKPQQIQEHWDGVLGFHTNKATKKMIIDTLNAAMRDEEYEERNLLACDECDTYQYNADDWRKMNAVEGKKDDRVISRAGAIWLSNQMDSVQEIDIAERHKPLAKKGAFQTFT